MGLTIREASAVNLLLGYLDPRLNRGRPPVTRGIAAEAAQVLAAGAHKALKAGVQASDIPPGWDPQDTQPAPVIRTVDGTEMYLDGTPVGCLTCEDDAVALCDQCANAVYTKRAAT